MGETVLTTWVSPSYATMLAQADEYLAVMQAKDGLSDQNRVFLRMMEMLLRNRFEHQYRAKEMRRTYALEAFVPQRFVAKHGGVEVAFRLTTPKMVLNDQLGFLDNEIVLNTISALRHTWSANGHDIRQQRLAEANDAAIYAAATCFTVAEHTRQWRVPFGVKLLPLVAD